MTTTPPLVPADVDLRDYPAMMLDVVRLRDSELAGNPDGNIFRDNVLSWCVSWHQQPAGSLPDDDASLAKLLGYGRDIKGWVKAREKGSLRGWVKCSDGRLYHPVVAEKALEAWQSKQLQRWRTECARIKKAAQRNGERGIVPAFEQWLSLGCPQGQARAVPKDIAAMSPGTMSECPQGQTTVVPEEMASNRSEVKVNLKPKTNTLARTTTTSTAVAPTPGGAVCARLRAAGMADCNPQHPRLLALLAAGITADEIEAAGVDAVRAGKGFAYALAMAEGRRRDATTVQALPDARASPRRQTLTESRAATIAGLTGAQPQQEQRHEHNRERDITADCQRLPAAGSVG